MKDNKIDCSIDCIPEKDDDGTDSTDNNHSNCSNNIDDNNK